MQIQKLLSTLRRQRRTIDQAISALQAIGRRRPGPAPKKAARVGKKPLTFQAAPPLPAQTQKSKPGPKLIEFPRDKRTG
jgi:hypothetical protein